MGLFSCLGTKEDTIIYDQHIHASAREGIRLSVARSYSFIHNDYEDLEKKIKNASGDIYVAIEGIYSMHGDIPDKKALIALQKKYGFYLIVDEAHSVGILGEKGKGWSEEIDRSSLFAKVITFGKAFGFHGALVTGNAKLKEYLINFSKPFIYTTAPAENAFETVAIIHDYFSRYQNELRKKLLENITHYNKARNESLVSPIKIVENREIENIYSHLQKANIQCKIIRPPTVEKDREIIRICLHNFNTREEVKLLTNIIENV